MEDLPTLSPEELFALYSAAPVGSWPTERMNGMAIERPGRPLSLARARASRLVWQGKMFSGNGADVVNIFFGLPLIRGVVYPEISWHDGKPSMIIDYQNTSLVFGPYRDEFREIAPGLWLGIMYERTCPRPKFVRFFAFELRGPHCLTGK